MHKFLPKYFAAGLYVFESGIENNISPDASDFTFPDLVLWLGSEKLSRKFGNM